MSTSFPTTSKFLEGKTTTTEISVQSSSVSFTTSGPHSILDVGLHNDKQNDLSEMQTKNVKIGQNSHSLQVNYNQDSPILQPNEPVSDEDIPTTPTTASKRPPPLEVDTANFLS